MRTKLAALLFISAINVFGYSSYSGWCQQGGQPVTVQGIPSTTLVQQSYPNRNASGSGPNVTVYLTGTVNKATIYSDNAGTALGNPLPCTATGQYQFFAAEEVVDLTFAGSGVSSYTISKVPLSEPLGVVSDVGGAPNSLATLCSRANSLGATLTIALAWTQNTESLNCSTLFLQGGIIQPASGQTVTLSQNTGCPLTQRCYDISLGGTIAFSTPPAMDSPIQWGADITGVADSASMFNASFAAIASGSAGTVTLPCGAFNLGSTWNTRYAYMSKVQGSGACTNLNWTGGSTGALINDANCFQCSLSDFRIIVSPSFPLQYAIRTQHDSSGLGYTATANRFINIQIEGEAALYTGIEIDGPVDANNDQQRFETVKVYGYTHSAWTLGNVSAGFNIFDVVMDHCTFVAGGFGAYGVENFHGNFHWVNGSDGGGNSVSDFLLAPGGGGGSDVRDSEFEDSSQLITTSGPGLIASAFTIDNVHFGGECVGATAMQIQNNCSGYTPSGNMITWKLLGPLKVTQSSLGAVGPNAITIFLQYSSSSQTGPNYVFDGNVFGSTNTTISSLFSSAHPQFFTNNAYFAFGGAYTSYPNLVGGKQFLTGTWTPVLAFGGNSTGMTCSCSGFYSLSNGVVTFSIVISLSAAGSSTGDATVSLPTTANLGGAATLGLMNNMSAVDTKWSDSPNGQIQPGNAVINLEYTSSDAGQTGSRFLQETAFTDTSTMRISGSYLQNN